MEGLALARSRPLRDSFFSREKRLRLRGNNDRSIVIDDGRKGSSGLELSAPLLDGLDSLGEKSAGRSAYCESCGSHRSWRHRTRERARKRKAMKEGSLVAIVEHNSRQAR